MMKKRRVTLLLAKNIAARLLVPAQKILQGIEFVAEHVEKQGVVRRDDYLELACSLLEKLSQVAGHSDGIVFVQRRNRIVNVDIFHPVIGIYCFIHCDFNNGEEEAPNENVLLA